MKTVRTRWRALRRVRTSTLALALALASVTITTPAQAQPSPAARTRQSFEEELAREARVETIVRVALANNPDLSEADARIRAARQRAPAAGRLPDPEFKYELWGG